MKFTKLFTAALCGSMLLASCSFDGTKSTLEEDLKAKYENNDTVEITSGKKAALTISESIISWGKDNTDPEKVTKRTAKLSASYSLPSVDGITIQKVVSVDAKTPLSYIPYAGTTVELDPADPTQKTVLITVSGKDEPEDYMIKADATVVKAINGAMLDKDGDKFWGEAEDSVYITDVDVSKGYYLTGRETWSLTWDSRQKNVEGTDVPGTFEFFTTTLDENKATLDGLYWAESYDAASDTWSKITTQTSAANNGVYSITYVLSSYVPVRLCQGEVSKATLKVGTKDVNYAVPYTTEKHPIAPTAGVAVKVADSKTAENNADGYFSQKSTDISSENLVSNKGNGVIEIAGPTSISGYYTDVTEKNPVTALSFEKFTAADKSGIKVVRKDATSSSVKYVEVAVSDVAIVNEGKNIRITLADKELKSTEYDNLIILANKGVTFECKAYVGASATEKSSVTLKLGTLAPATSTITKGGWQVLKGTL